MNNYKEKLRLLAPMKLELKFLKGDVFGGLTTGVVALPLALAFGVSSGLEGGAQAGLYSAIILGFVAAIFGGTKPQVSGPTGPMTVVAAGFVATASDPKNIFLAVALGGVLQVVFGFFGLGGYIRYIPRPVISGFMTGIGLIILCLQIQPMLGHPNEPGPVKALLGMGEALSGINVQALILGAIVLALIYIIPRISKAVPAALIALLIGTIFSEWQGFDVPKIGELPSGLPSFSFTLPQADAYLPILMAGITLAVLGSLDSLLGSVVVDQITNTRHDSDKELVGQGMGNLASGLFGGLPGAGATMRTLLNIRVGGTTGLSGVIHSTLLTAILLGLSKYAALIPLSVLAGILVSVGIGIIDYDGLRKLPKAPRPDQIVLVLVLSLTVFVDLITAVQMGFLLASLLFLKNLSDRELTRSGNLTSMVLTDGNDEAVNLAESVQVIQAEGPIFFGTSEAFVEAFDGNEEGPVKAIIIRMTRVPVIDQTGAFALKEFVERMGHKNVVVMLSGLPELPLQVLRDLSIIPNTIPEDTVFPTLAEAVVGLNKKLELENVLVPQPYLPKVGG